MRVVPSRPPAVDHQPSSVRRISWDRSARSGPACPIPTNDSRRTGSSAAAWGRVGQSRSCRTNSNATARSGSAWSGVSRSTKRCGSPYTRAAVMPRGYVGAGRGDAPAGGQPARTPAGAAEHVGTYAHRLTQPPHRGVRGSAPGLASPAEAGERSPRSHLSHAAGGLGLEPRLQGSKGLRAADYPIPHGRGQPTRTRAASRTVIPPTGLAGYGTVGYGGVGKCPGRPAPSDPVRTA
jgi:hypothetical protein